MPIASSDGTVAPKTNTTNNNQDPWSKHTRTNQKERGGDEYHGPVCFCFEPAAFPIAEKHTDTAPQRETQSQGLFEPVTNLETDTAFRSTQVGAMLLPDSWQST
jgi:hypothetical protein